jgi:hypothetical protein
MASVVMLAIASWSGCRVPRVFVRLPALDPAQLKALDDGTGDPPRLFYPLGLVRLEPEAAPDRVGDRLD